jgi:Na+-driven multidrug efflux pump
LKEFYGIDGVWMSFPIADISSTIITAFFLWKAMQKLQNAPEREMVDQKE